MKLYRNCISCKEEIIIKSRAKTRPDLQMEKRKEFMVNCLSYGKQEKKHVNDVRATSDKKIILIGLGIGVIAFSVLFFSYGWIGTLGVVIPLIFMKEQENATKAFNSFLVKR